MKEEYRGKLVVSLCEELVNNKSTKILKIDSCRWGLYNGEFLKEFGDFDSIEVSDKGIKLSACSNWIFISIDAKSLEQAISVLRNYEEKLGDEMLKRFSQTFDENLCCNK